jgi:opacity protein-like surface antigen
MHAHSLIAASISCVLVVDHATAQVPAGAPEQAIAPATAQEFSNRVYIGTSLGAAFLPTLKISDEFATEAAYGLTDVGLDTDIGAAFTIALGIHATENFSLEVQTGLTWVGFGGASGEVSYLQRTGGDPTPDFDATLSGGSGSFLQVPVMANATWRIPLTKRAPGTDDTSIGLILGGGFGAINTGADISGIDVAPTTGTVPDYTMSIKGNGWSWAAQARVGLDIALSSRVSLGLEYRLIGLNEADLGSADFSEDLDRFSDITIETFIEQTVSATLEFRF